MKKKEQYSQADQKFETALEEYLSAVIEVEKEEYHSDLQPFTAVEGEIRSKVGDSLRFFQENYSNGYQVLIEELKREMETSESKEDLLALVIVDPEKLKIFEDSEALMGALREGNSIYQLLGFSEKALNVFYRAANRLIENKEFKKARDIFYFLVTIAPEVYQFWISFGQCCKNLEEHEMALQLFLQAIDIDPTQAVAYLNVIDFFVQAHDFHKALEFCTVGLHFALEHQREPWAEPLRSMLEEKRHCIS